MFRDEALAPDAHTRELLDESVVRPLWPEHQAGEHDQQLRLWVLLTLERSLRQIERPPEAQPPASVRLAA